jgi:hypothetical protein
MEPASTPAIMNNLKVSFMVASSKGKRAEV